MSAYSSAVSPTPASTPDQDVVFSAAPLQSPIRTRFVVQPFEASPAPKKPVVSILSRQLAARRASSPLTPILTTHDIHLLTGQKDPVTPAPQLGDGLAAPPSSPLCVSDTLQKVAQAMNVRLEDKTSSALVIKEGDRAIPWAPEVVDEKGLNEEEIQTIVSQTSVSRAKAVKALRKTRNVIDAILELTETMQPHSPAITKRSFDSYSSSEPGCFGVSCSQPMNIPDAKAAFSSPSLQFSMSFKESTNAHRGSDADDLEELGEDEFRLNEYGGDTTPIPRYSRFLGLDFDGDDRTYMAHGTYDHIKQSCLRNVGPRTDIKGAGANISTL